MRILVVNPNTSAETTDVIRAAAEAAAAPGTEVLAVTAPRGPREIASPEQAAAQAPVVVEAIQPYADRVDAAVIAAFSDPGLEEARRAFAFPVVGIGEALLREAAARGRFALLVPNPANEATYRRMAAGAAASDRMIGIRYLYPLLPPGSSTSEALRAALVAQARAAVSEDGAEVVAIGGGPLAGAGAAVEAVVSVPVLESVPAGVRSAERRAGKGADREP